jgi:hypothetical protein
MSPRGLTIPAVANHSSGMTTVVLGGFAYLGTVPACIAATACWVAILISDGPLASLKYSWLLAIAAYLGLRPLLAKLRVGGSSFA